MDTLFMIAVLAVIAFIVIRISRKSRAKQRSDLIDSYEFPLRIRDKVASTYPHLDDRQVDQVLDGLRDYFHVCNTAGKRMVSMPSQAVDVAWHEFILFTKNYQQFCSKALGRFLHHTPAEAMSSPTMAQIGIKTAWRIACTREEINPKTPDRLPRLFAMDAALAIPGGFTYALNCKTSDYQPGNYPYCASHIGCGSGCSSGGEGSDIGGDGDSGCGGGCGGD
ncbi:hypothetical protein QKW35_19680 [Pontibacterium granulatum]|uniref:glycine-rich domain-containing protein n=1 Tax=Pontibacterium granulatum TaxID=2036029 RepID=UPI00249A4DCB|nr:hypothetical protein [Pontibacterium granulatum]MDI3326604.1 hypothetical protein [Pontibacterium granulatum]